MEEHQLEHSEIASVFAQLTTLEHTVRSLIFVILVLMVKSVRTEAHPQVFLEVMSTMIRELITRDIKEIIEIMRVAHVCVFFTGMELTANLQQPVTLDTMVNLA
jgi:hypothetical protein